MMTASDRIDPPDDPPNDDPTTIGFWQQQALHFEAQFLEYKAKDDIREKAAAAALARELDRGNPDRDWQTVLSACCAVGVNGKSDEKKVARWYRLKKIYGLKIDDRGHFVVCVNDLRDFLNKTGRHR
jgi:hypothetical protein